jgi:hypothetical protein
MLSQACQIKEDARLVHSRSSSLPPGKIMATKEIWVHPLYNYVMFLFLLLCIIIVKIIVGIQTIQTSRLSSGFHLFGRTGGKFFSFPKHQDSHPPVMVSICLAEQVAGFGALFQTCTIVMEL